MYGFVFRKGGSFVSVLGVEQDRQSIVIVINGVGKAVDQPETMLEKFGIEFSEFREKEKNRLFCQRGTDISSFIICTVSSDFCVSGSFNRSLTDGAMPFDVFAAFPLSY